MIIALLQARFSSTRLPGKAMLPLLGKPMLLHQIERITQSQRIEKLVVVTSVDSSDDVIARLCTENNIAYFRGDLNNVLDRFYQAAQEYSPSAIVRLTGDCPLTDYQVIDAVVDHHIATKADYTSNVLPPTFPDGVDVEVFSYTCLQQAWYEALLPSHKEHVTPFIHTQPDRFAITNFTHPTDLSSLRWTVDEPADFAFVTKIYQHLYNQNPNFSISDILKLLEQNPQLSTINKDHQRNEGYKKSLVHDSFFAQSRGEENV